MTYVDLKGVLGIHRQDALFCPKVQNPVDSRPVQSGSDAVYMVVHGFGRDMLTELTDSVQDWVGVGGVTR